MSSWKSKNIKSIKNLKGFKSKKPIGNSQSKIIRTTKSVDDIFIQKKIYNIDRSKQYKICIQIDNNLYKQKNISNINELIIEYENFVSLKQISNSNLFLSKLREMRYNDQYNEELDIHFVDLMSRLIKYLTLFHDTAVEAFFDLVIHTKKDELINTLVPFYLMNFNKKYYDYI